MKKIFSILVIALILTGCDLGKVDTEGMNDNCKAFYACMYLNQNNPDKSVCSSLANGCKSANDFSMCMKAEGIDFKDCLLLHKK